MGMLTSGRVEIAAPAMDVWAWLVDPVRLTTWLGGSGGLPEDPAELHVGWTATNSTAAGSVRVEVTAFEPPTLLAYRSTYERGDQLVSYRLTEGEGVTTVVLEGDTDWGRPEEALPDALEERLVEGEFDAAASPQLQLAMAAQLQKLKALVEGEQTAKN